MKQFGILLLALFITVFSYADQLAYITKAEAEEAAAYINKHKKVLLFCGCCSLIEPEKVTVVRAEAVHTGYEDYYEVTIHYLDDEGQEVNKNIDLAYVWTKRLFRYKTLGAVFNMEHDHCVTPNNWNNPKFVEEDI
jgi:hypothetical protein